MISSGIDINELRRNNVEFLIKKYKEKSMMSGIRDTFLESVIEDLEISQKEWVEYENEEHPNTHTMLRTDYYLKKQRDMNELERKKEIIGRFLRLDKGEVVDMVMKLENDIKHLIGKYESEGDYYMDENDTPQLRTSKDIVEDLRKLYRYG
jgi:hypothetical protein